jgi:O-antigen/teichoic acid export membrane protein
VIVLVGMADDIIYLLLGQNYVRAVLPLQITAPLVVIVSLSGIFGFQVLSALSKDSSILISAIVGMLVSIVLSIIFVPRFMENGEAITILFTELSVCLSFIYFSAKYFNLKGYVTIFLKQLLESIPYLIILILIRLSIDVYFYRLIATAILSFSWFCVLHFYIHSNSIYKTQLIRILDKIRIK